MTTVFLSAAGIHSLYNIEDASAGLNPKEEKIRS